MKKFCGSIFLVTFLVFKLGFSESSKIIYDQKRVLKETQESFNILTGPENLVVGGHCGRAGQKTKGLGAIQALARNKRLDLIHKVLNGANLSGQVYAAWAYIELQKMGFQISAADRSVIEHLKKSYKTVQACNGCIYSQTSLRSILDPKEGPLMGVSLVERSEFYRQDESKK